MADRGKKGDAKDLARIRKRINEVDAQIQDLINERARFAQQVGLAKGDLSSAVDYYRPEREAEILRAIVERNEGPLRNEEILRLFSSLAVLTPNRSQCSIQEAADCSIGQTFRP